MLVVFDGNGRENCHAFTEKQSTSYCVGSSNVGKTSLVEYLLEERVCEEFREVNKTHKNWEIIVELIDIDKYTSPYMRRLAIKIAHAYILMYSVDVPDSFDTISAIKDEIIEIKGQGMPMIIVGNKADLVDRTIQRVTPASVGHTSLGIPNIEVSVYKKYNLNGVYKHLFKHPTLKKLVDVVSLLYDSLMSVDDIAGRVLSMYDAPHQGMFELAKRPRSESLTPSKPREEPPPNSVFRKLKNYFTNIFP